MVCLQSDMKISKNKGQFHLVVTCPRRNDDAGLCDSQQQRLCSENLCLSFLRYARTALEQAVFAPWRLASFFGPFLSLIRGPFPSNVEPNLLNDGL